MDQASPSQSLFQVYYLSAVEIDKRCGSSVLPWIIEELKLKLETAQDMRLIWITLGTYVVHICLFLILSSSTVKVILCICVVMELLFQLCTIIVPFSKSSVL